MRVLSSRGELPDVGLLPVGRPRCRTPIILRPRGQLGNLAPQDTNSYRNTFMYIVLHFLLEGETKSLKHIALWRIKNMNYEPV